MSKSIVSKEIYNILEELKRKNLSQYGTIYDVIVKNNELSSVSSVEAIKAFLNPDGYELELSMEDKAINKYKKLNEISNKSNSEIRFDKAVALGMRWMDEKFSLGLNFHLLDDE